MLYLDVAVEILRKLSTCGGDLFIEQFLVVVVLDNQTRIGEDDAPDIGGRTAEGVGHVPRRRRLGHLRRRCLHLPPPLMWLYSMCAVEKTTFKRGQFDAAGARNHQNAKKRRNTAIHASAARNQLPGRRDDPTRGTMSCRGSCLDGNRPAVRAAAVGSEEISRAGLLGVLYQSACIPGVRRLGSREGGSPAGRNVRAPSVHAARLAERARTPPFPPSAHLRRRRRSAARPRTPSRVTFERDLAAADKLDAETAAGVNKTGRRWDDDWRNLPRPMSARPIVSLPARRSAGKEKPLPEMDEFTAAGVAELVKIFALPPRAARSSAWLKICGPTTTRERGARAAARVVL